MMQFFGIDAKPISMFEKSMTLGTPVNVLVRCEKWEKYKIDIQVIKVHDIEYIFNHDMSNAVNFDNNEFLENHWDNEYDEKIKQFDGAFYDRDLTEVLELMLLDYYR